jgi:hypothetical protein
MVHTQRFIAQPFNIVLIILWHSLLSVAYIFSYPAIQAECPSLKIILAISASMPQGLSAEAIVNLFIENKLLTESLDSLVNSGLLSLRNGKWVVSAKRRFLFTLFSLYRSLLKLPLGEE